MTVVHEPDGGASDAPGQLEDLLNAAIARIRGLVEADVERVRRRRPGLSRDELARALVKRGTRRVGAASFATGFGGAPTLAVNVTSVLTLQAATVLAVAAAYDELDSPDLRQVRLVGPGPGYSHGRRCSRPPRRPPGRASRTTSATSPPPW